METTKKIYAPNELVCAEAIHPGEMLKDELQARGISQKKFAAIIDMPYTAFNEIINGKRPITTDTALKIEAATNIAANIWLGLQADYNMQTARHDSKLSVILEHIRKSVAVL
ncbi:MAG: HigA family addiction module antidote protein [Prevotella sp.]|nr:HigA family addiction module antidote protein [Prevotella sp.]